MMDSMVLEPGLAQRFTVDGGVELERRLESLCREIREETLSLVPPPRLEALVLGGGYGRGQGGVLKTPVGEAPYNDLEFYVFLRGNQVLNEARYGRKFRHLGDQLSPKAGLHVEFKVDSLEQLSRRPVSIFSYDLVSGHRVIFGGRDPFRGCEYHQESSRIVPAEATRLLLNRCSGLLLAQELLGQSVLSEEDCDFVGRNLAKTKLALGDALLAATGSYHWDCLERARRLGRLDMTSQGSLLRTVLKHHSAGVRFKLHPVKLVKTPDQFKAEHDELTRLAFEEWLWIENRRLKANFATLREYAFSSIDKCDGNAVWRNVLLNLKTFGAGATLDRYAPRYPRERLFNALPLLLGGDRYVRECDTKRHLQRQLRTRAEDWHGLVAAYKHVWSCYG